MALAIDLDVFNVGSTPLQMLLTVLILTVLVGVVIVIVTQVFSPYLNRRWPATAPLSPTELLWGEAGGHVKRTFRGLDLEDQKDLASQLNERKVAAGAVITSQGDPATAFYLLKSGSAEVVQSDASGERKLREYAEGESFGEIAILERSPRTATVRALTDCVVLELPAEDFVAAAAQTAAEGNDFTVIARQFLVADRARARIAAGEPAMNPVQQVQHAAPSAPSGPPAAGNATVTFEVAAAAAAAPPVAAPPVAAPPAAAPPAAAPPPAPPAAVPPAPGAAGAPGAAATGAAAAAARPARRPAPANPVQRAIQDRQSTAPGWQATHRVGASGAPARGSADPNAAPTTTLQPGTLVRTVERSGDWARVDAENGWSGWVDARLLDPAGP